MLQREAYPPGAALEGMAICTFGAAERQRYWHRNTFVITFDGDTDSSESSSTSSSDDNAGAPARQLVASTNGRAAL